MNATPLRITYLLMSWPMPSQPFAISDVLALQNLGHSVTVRALRPAQPEHLEAAREYGLTLDERSHPTWKGTGSVAVRPRNLGLATRLAGVISRHVGARGGQLARATALIPRLVDIADEMRDDPPDVVHAFWGHYPALALPLVERVAPKAVRSMFLGAYDLTTHFLPAAPHLAATSHTVFTHAAENLELLAERGVDPDRVTVVPRGIPLDLANTPAGEKEPGLILTAANFQKAKNIDRIIDAMPMVLAKHPGARLEIAGDGAEREALKAQVARLDLAEKVTFLGMLPREALFARMRAATIFAFASTKPSERLPNVVKEAMLARCHIITSHTPGIEALVEDGATGEIARDIAPEALAQRIDAALVEKKQETSGPLSEKHIRDHFSAEAAMERYVDRWRGGAGV